MRLERFRAALPARVAAAHEELAGTLGVDVPRFEVRIEDAGADRSGAFAEVRDVRGETVLFLKSEYCVLGAFDVERTLVHELFHCLHRKRLGAAAYARTPEWAREGAALWVAGQGAARARVLAAFAGRDARFADPVARLVDGLEGPHDFLDYYEDAAAFEAVEERHGRDEALALVRALLETRDVRRAIRDVLGEEFEAFERAAAARARRVLRPLVETGRGPLLEATRRIEVKDAEGALAALEPKGVYRAASALVRARALERAGRAAEALACVREDFLARWRCETTLLDRALRLELRLLEALDRPDVAEARARAALDLEPFG